MRSLYTDIDDIGDSLVNKGQFTVDKLEIVMEHLGQYIQNHGDQKYFTVKTITVHPDHIAQLGSNYTYTVQDDYVSPEMPVKFEEEERINEDVVFNEAIGEILDEIEESLELYPITEEELAHDLYGVDNDNIEVTLKTELLPTNHQIETNESTDIDWF
jgi:hypothetical protein